MKTRTILCALAATMMLFAACGKDDDKTDNTLNIADNTLVYDGVTYHMQAYQSFFHNELTLVDGGSEELDADGSYMVEFSGLHVRPGMWNRTADIFTETTDEVYWGCYFGGAAMGDGYNVYDDFSACRIGIYGNNDGTPVTVTVDGTLKNGKTLQMKVITKDGPEVD